MNANWGKSSETKYSVQGVMAMAREARLSKMWIKYDSTWYTPEELEAVAEIRTFEEGRLFLRDPIMAIRAGRAHIDDLQAKLTEFNVKVAEYYRNK